MNPRTVSLRLLAVDTTSEHGSIAISEGENVIEEVAIDSPDGFGHIVFDEILRLLSRHVLSLQDMDGFAAAAGPGSFTGVRVGLTAVKGLAEANGKQAVAVSNLQALASFGSRPLRATVLDAHRGEIYGAVYDASLQLVQDEVVTPFEAWFAALPSRDASGDLELIASGFAVAECRYPVVQAPRALAGAIAKIAARRFAQGLAQDPALIDANYVRRSDAELLWREPSPARVRRTP
jgi:tRNA threonylcarbamoyladenosine biosynthesis protein TsaB